MAITKVGGDAVNDIPINSTEDTTLPSGLQQDDIVVVAISSDGNFVVEGGGINTTGYTTIANVNTSSPGHIIAYKFMGATPDTVVNITSPSGDSAQVCVQAWRGVDTTTPIDATATSASGASGMPNPPSYTPVTNDALRIIVGLMDDDLPTSIAAPTGYTNLVTQGVNTDATTMMASKIDADAGAEDPGAFTGGTPNSDAWYAYHFALRPASGGGAFTLTADGGSYGITGTAASLEVGKLVSAGGGSYAISGTAASLEHSYSLTASGGSYAISGSAVTLLHASLVSASSGIYIISGSAATLSKTIPIVADSGSYSISGSAADLENGRLVAAESGSYELAGTDANLEFGRLLSAAGSSYSISGADVTFTKGFGVVADSGTYAIGGGAASLLVSKLLAASGGSYAVTGADTTLTYDTGGGSPAIGIIEPPLRRRRR